MYIYIYIYIYIYTYIYILAYKTLRATVTIFFSHFFQLSFSDGKFVSLFLPSYIYL